MKTRISVLTMVFVFAGIWTVSSDATPAHLPRVARMTLANGSVRTITLEGVGCSETLCSRVVVSSKGAGDSRITRTSLDSIAAITDITSETALFMLKDGTARRLAVVRDNRYLYFADQSGASGKIDLKGVRSVEFLSSGR